MIRLDKASEIFGKYKKYRKTNINMRKNIKNVGRSCIRYQIYGNNRIEY